MRISHKRINAKMFLHPLCLFGRSGPILMQINVTMKIGKIQIGQDNVFKICYINAMDYYVWPNLEAINLWVVLTSCKFKNFNKINFMFPFLKHHPVWSVNLLNKTNKFLGDLICKHANYHIYISPRFACFPVWDSFYGRKTSN